MHLAVLFSSSFPIPNILPDVTLRYTRVTKHVSQLLVNRIKANLKSMCLHFYYLGHCLISSHWGTHTLHLTSAPGLRASPLLSSGLRASPLLRLTLVPLPCCCPGLCTFGNPESDSFQRLSNFVAARPLSH